MMMFLMKLLYPVLISKLTRRINTYIYNNDTDYQTLPITLNYFNAKKYEFQQNPE